MSITQNVPRRRVLKILGAATVAPAVAEGARLFHPLVPPQEGGGPWRPRFFTADENATIETVAELIIPETETPGAGAANVHQYIDWRVSQAAETARSSLPAIMREGLAWLDRRAETLHGRRFVEVDAEQQTDLLTRLAADPPREAETGVEFFRQVRRLTIAGYYRSEPGMREEMGYDGKRYLTRFDGCTHDHHLNWTPETPAGRG